MRSLLILLLAPIAWGQEITLTASGVMVEKGNTIVQVRATCDGGNLTAFENKPGTIRKFKDNMGANLMINTRHWTWTRNVEVARNGRYATLELVSGSAPARGATAIQLEGVLNFLLADGRVKAREVIDLQKNVTGSVGELFYEVRQVRSVQGEPLKSVQILFQDYIPEKSNVLRLAYYVDGEELDEKAHKFVRNKAGHMALLKLPRDMKTLEIEVEYWLNAHKVTAPYTFELDL